MSPRRSHVYVDLCWMQPGQPTRSAAVNGAYTILQRHYQDLPIGAVEDFDALRAMQHREWRQMRAWADSFRAAYRNGEPLPSRGFGPTVRVGTSSEKGASDMRSLPRAFLAVLEAGPRGVTSIEARRAGDVGGGISGALSKLHAAGIIACLERTR